MTTLERVESQYAKLLPRGDDLRALIYFDRGFEKYGEPFLIAEGLKREMRERYYAAVAATHGEPRERFLARSREMWEEYEEINRLWLPEDPVFSGVRNNVTLATTTDFWTLSCGASGQLRLLESFIGGEATTSTVLRAVINRATGGTTPTNVTPEKMNTRSPAAVATFASTWSAQPTLGTNDLVSQAFNAFGGTDRWVPQPGEEVYSVNAEILSCRSRSGIPVVSGHSIWEEL